MSAAKKPSPTKSNILGVTTIQKKSYRNAIGISGIFLFLDQLFKFLAHTNQSFQAYLIDPWLGWEYLANRGVAFGAPVPNMFLVAEKKHKTPHYVIAVALILVGAVSNYIDRVLFGITIDYLRIITAVFNIADVMILAGALWILFDEYTHNNHPHT